MFGIARTTATAGPAALLQRRRPGRRRRSTAAASLRRRRPRPRRPGTSGGFTASTAARHSGTDSDVGDAGKLRLQLTAPLGDDLHDGDRLRRVPARRQQPPEQRRAHVAAAHDHQLVAHRLTVTPPRSARCPGRRGRSRHPRDAPARTPLMGVATTAKGKAARQSRNREANPMRSSAPEVLLDDRVERSDHTVDLRLAQHAAAAGRRGGTRRPRSRSRSGRRRAGR